MKRERLLDRIIVSTRSFHVTINTTKTVRCRKNAQKDNTKNLLNKQSLLVHKLWVIIVRVENLQISDQLGLVFAQN